MKIKEFFISTVFGFISAWFGVLAIPVILLLCCNLTDCVTGIMASYSQGNAFKSRTLRNGILCKVGTWLAVLVAWFMDVAISSGVSYTAWNPPFHELLATVVCLWLVFSEIISIIENISKLGTNVPPFLITIAEKMRNGEEVVGNNIPPSNK